MATLLVGVVLVAALNTVGGVARSWRATSQQNIPWLLASELLTEIASLPYVDPVTEPPMFGLEDDELSKPGNRLVFDDVDDYDKWEEKTGILFRDGTVQTTYAGWQRSVVIQHMAWVNPTTPISDSSDQGLKRIEVCIKSPESKNTYWYALRSKTGAAEQALGVDVAIVHGMTVKLDAGGAPESQQGTNTLNHSKGP